MKFILAIIYDSKTHQPVPACIVFMQTDSNHGCFGTTDNLGRCALNPPEFLDDTQFTISAAGYYAYSTHINLGMGNKQIRVGLAADPNRPQDIILDGLEPISFNPPNTFEPVSVFGKGFRTVNSNQHWQQLNITAFKLFYNYTRGIDIKPFCEWASQHGNTVRVFFTCRNEFGLSPEDYNNDQISAFLAYLRTCNLHCEVVAFADYGLIFGNDTTRALNYYDSLVHELHELDNVFLELVNEHDVAQNEVPPNVFGRPTKTISSSGSGGGDSDPVTPPWDYMTFHLGRNNEWPRKAKSAMEFQDAYNVPCTNNETNRPDLAGFVISDFKDCGHVSALLSAGVNAHSLALKHAEIPEGLERTCVESILAAAKQVPSYVQVEGHYTRGGLSDCPMIHSDTTALRTFARIIDNEAWCVIVRPTIDNPRKAANGWKIIENWDNLYHLVRM